MKQSLTIPGTLPDLNSTLAAAKQHWSRYAREKKHFTHTIAHLERDYQRRFDRLGTGLIFVCPLTLIALMLPRG